MISATFSIARTIVLASLALGSAAWAATCSNASLSGTYGFLHGGTNSNGLPIAGLTQVRFNSSAGTYIGEDLTSIDGVIELLPVTATYAVAPNCTVVAKVSVGGSPATDVSFVVTSTGFLFLFQKPGATSSGFGVKQGSPVCTNDRIQGSFGFETTGVFLAGAPVTGPVAFIGEFKLTVSPSGEGLISGHLAGSEDGTILNFAEEPVTGSYTIGKDCRGTATVAPKGLPEMHFSLLVVDGGKEMMAIETDADTVVDGTLVKRD